MHVYSIRFKGIQGAATGYIGSLRGGLEGSAERQGVSEGIAE